MALITAEKALLRLARECALAGGQQEWAWQHGLSPQYVCDALKGRRSLGPSLTRALGLRFVPMYEEVHPCKPVFA